MHNQINQKELEGKINNFKRIGYVLCKNVKKDIHHKGLFNSIWNWNIIVSSVNQNNQKKIKEIN